MRPWSTLVKFQRTRGVLRLMAAVIHSLWEKAAVHLAFPPHGPGADVERVDDPPVFRRRAAPELAPGIEAAERLFYRLGADDGRDVESVVPDDRQAMARMVRGLVRRSLTPGMRRPAR